MPSFDIRIDKPDIQTNEPALQKRAGSLGGDSPLRDRLQSLPDPDSSDIGPHEPSLDDNPPLQGWAFYRKRLRPLNPPAADDKDFAGRLSSDKEQGPPGPRSRSQSLPTISPNAFRRRKSSEDVDEISPPRSKTRDQYAQQTHMQRHIDHLAQKNLSRNVKSAFNPHAGRFSCTSRYRWAKGYEQSLMQTADNQDEETRPEDLRQRIWHRHGGPPQTTQQRLWRLREDIQNKIPSLNRTLGYRVNENPFLHIEELQQEVEKNPLTASPTARKIVTLHREMLDLGIDPFQDLEQLKRSVGKDQGVDKAYGDGEKLRDLSDALGKMAYLQGKRSQQARCAPTADAYSHILSDYRKKLTRVTEELDAMIKNLELPKKITSKRKTKEELESTIRTIEDSRDANKIAEELAKRQTLTNQINDYLPKYDTAKDKAIELGVELASKARIGFDENTNKFVKTHFNLAIDKRDPLFNEGDLEKREALIEQAEAKLDQDRTSLEHQPPSDAKRGREEALWREEEKICLAKEKLYRKVLDGLGSKKTKDADDGTSHRRQTAIYMRLLKNTLADKQRILDRKENALQQKNRTFLESLAGNENKLLGALKEKFTDIRDAHGAYGSVAEWKRTQSTTAKVGRAWKRFWSGVFKSVDFTEDATKISAHDIESDEASLHKPSDRLEAAATGFEIAENSLGIIKSHHKLWHRIRAAFRRKGPETQPVEEVTEKNTVEWARSAPQRMLNQAKRAASKRLWYRKFLGFWKKTDIPAEVLDAARYDAGLLSSSAKMAGAKGAFWSAVASKTVAKGSAIAGAVVTGKDAVQFGFEAHEARMEDQKRSQALNQTKAMFTEQHRKPNGSTLHDSLRDLDALVALGEKKGNWKRKAGGAGVNAAASTGFTLAAIAGFSVGGAALTIGAPVTGGVAATGGLAYAAYREGKEYVDAETLKLHEDAFTGRVGGKTVSALNEAARKSGITDLRAHLDQQLIRSDTRYATQRTLVNLKREMRLGYTEAELKDHLRARIDAKARRMDGDDTEIDIYDYDREDDDFKRFDDTRLKASPHAQFLMQMGMSRGDVLTLADSRDDERTNEVCRQLIQMSLRLKG